VGSDVFKKRPTPVAEQSAECFFLGCRCKLRQEIGSPTPVTTMLREISVRDVTLLHETPIKKGQSFLLDLPRVTGEPVPIWCRAILCKAGGTGCTAFRITAVFTGGGWAGADANATTLIEPPNTASRRNTIVGSLL
jgi:hypothetical protein